MKLLKTKTRNSHFCFTKPINILKKRRLAEIIVLQICARQTVVSSPAPRLPHDEPAAGDVGYMTQVAQPLSPYCLLPTAYSASHPARPQFSLRPCHRQTDSCAG